MTRRGRLALVLAAVAAAAANPAPAAAAVPAGYRLSLASQVAVDERTLGSLSFTIAPDPGYSISATSRSSR